MPTPYNYVPRRNPNLVTRTGGTSSSPIFQVVGRNPPPTYVEPTYMDLTGFDPNDLSWLNSPEGQVIAAGLTANTGLSSSTSNEVQRMGHEAWVEGQSKRISPTDMALLMMGGAAAGGAMSGAAGGGGAAGELTGVALPDIASIAPTTVAAGGSTGGVAAGAAGAAGAAAPAAAGGIMSSPWLTIAGIGSSLLGGHMGAEAAEDATEAQLQASREALDFQRESRDMALDLLRPEIEASQTALGRMLDMTGTPRPEGMGESQPFDITQDPSYQFRLDESMRALENSAAARGGLMSGGFARSALRYAQDFASTEYTNIYNRLASIANRTPVATQTASTALNFGSNASNISLNSGDARASGYIAQGNSWQNAMDQIALALGRQFGQPAGAV